MSGFITGVEITTNKRDHDIRKAIVGAYAAIRRKFRAELEREFYAADSKTVDPQHQEFVEMKASAWYAACYQDLQPGQPYTFPWIAWDYLCNIATRELKTQALKEGLTRTSVPGAKVDDPAVSSPDLLTGDVLGDVVIRTKQSDMMKTALKREREKMEAEKQESDLELLQQYTQPHLMPGVNSRVRSPQTALFGTSLASLMEELRACTVPADPNDMEPLLGGDLQINPRPLRNEITEQAGFVTIGPDADDAKLHEVFGFEAPALCTST